MTFSAHFVARFNTKCHFVDMYASSEPCTPHKFIPMAPQLARGPAYMQLMPRSHAMFAFLTRDYALSFRWTGNAVLTKYLQSLLCPEVYPEIPCYTVTMAPYGHLLHSLPLWRFVGIIFGTPNVVYPVKQKLKFLVVLE